MSDHEETNKYLVQKADVVFKVTKLYIIKCKTGSNNKLDMHQMMMTVDPSQYGGFRDGGLVLLPFTYVILHIK
jgi:hypothetical protein